ncbi:MAG: OmpA family protein [Paludibacteraceae bacterium]|nr:OmpA family protein [Paludibacteraceae bacterium]
MNRGKKTCEVLKSVRKQIAEANGIPYTPAECSFEGECAGTCPNCERERQYIEAQLSKKQKAGNALKIIGVAAGATAMVACQEAKAQENVEDITAVQQKFEWDYSFGFFGAAPRTEDEAQWKEMAEFVSLFPNDTFLVVGHTDCRGSLSYNEKLSQKRAEYFRSLLVARGADPDKVIPVGAAYTEPRIPDAQTEPEHEQNRRVTLEFYSREREKELRDKVKKELEE